VTEAQRLKIYCTCELSQIKRSLNETEGNGTGPKKGIYLEQAFGDSTDRAVGIFKANTSLL